MKVLYVGHYRDIPDGYGQAALDYILAMDAAGIDVVPRPIKLKNNTPDLPERILELEAKSAVGCDICIQHTLPHLMDYDGRFKKNIACWSTETETYKASHWPNRLNKMDCGWVSNRQMEGAAAYSGVTIPLFKIPHACNTDKFFRSYPIFNHERLEYNDNFIFYFIGEYNKRKNFSALLQAFHGEFDPIEPVDLVIKTNNEEIYTYCESVKFQMGKYSGTSWYKKEIIITEKLTEEELGSLHCRCDCFVVASHGEAWCLPAFDAIGYGNRVLATDTGGMADYLRLEVGHKVPAEISPIFGMPQGYSDLYNACDNWDNIDINMLKLYMRLEFEKNVIDKREEMSIDLVSKYSYNVIGNKIKDELEKLV